MPLDAKDKIDLEGLDSRFTYHLVQSDPLRTAALHLARIIVETCPSSAERSAALTHLDASVLFAHAAIARVG
jgi:hypothetical protein